MQATKKIFRSTNPNTELERLVEKILTGEEVVDAIMHYVGNRINNRLPEPGNPVNEIAIAAIIQEEGARILHEVSAYGVRRGDLTNDNLITFQNSLRTGALAGEGALAGAGAGATLGEYLTQVLTKAGVPPQTVQNITSNLGGLNNANMAVLKGVGCLLVMSIFLGTIYAIRSDKATVFYQINTSITTFLSNETLRRLNGIRNVAEQAVRGVIEQNNQLRERNDQMQREIDRIYTHLGLSRNSEINSQQRQI